MKRTFALCLTLALLLLCCACSGTPDTPVTTSETTQPPALTPAEIVERMQTALQETPCSEMKTEMDMTMTLDAGEFGSMDMTVKNTTTITISQNPISSYVTTVADVSYNGETSQTTTESYCIVEDGELMTYTNSNGIWLKTATGQTPESFAESASSVNVDPDNATIDETVTEFQGTDVICLITQIQGDALQDVIGSTLDGFGETGTTTSDAADLIASADYSALSCNAKLYLDAQTYLPLAEEMTFTGMSEVLAPVYAQMGVTVDVTSYTGLASFTSYEPQDAFTLPDGAAEKAEAWTRLLAGEPDNGDGTFTIREGAVLIDIAQPEGFEVSEKDYDFVTFTRSDYRTITYTMYYLSGTDSAGSEFTAMVDSNVSHYETNGGTVSRQQGTLSTDTLEFTCDLLGLTWDSGREDADFYAWVPLASDGTCTYYLLVEVTDGYNDGMGNTKSADITGDEFTAYLNAAAPGQLMQ